MVKDDNTCECGAFLLPGLTHPCPFQKDFGIRGLSQLELAQISQLVQVAKRLGAENMMKAIDTCLGAVPFIFANMEIDEVIAKIWAEWEKQSS